MIASIEARRQVEKPATLDSRQELLGYLSSPLETENCDPVRWWGVSISNSQLLIH